ncbi:hypothetical protein ACOMHN_050108 [Nucella lapillus]
MEFTFTKRNKRKLLHEGYAYFMDRTKADNVTIFWRCEKRGECKGRLKTVNDVLEGRPSTTHDCKRLLQVCLRNVRSTKHPSAKHPSAKRPVGKTSDSQTSIGERSIGGTSAHE